MSSAIITVEGLGKKYRLKHQAERQRYSTLRDTIADKARGFFKKLKTENLKSGNNVSVSASQHVSISSTEDFWALKDVSFEVKQGEVVGIIGRNGAGKSTLLKILSRITEPTEGRVHIKGRVASLLEVGTGFHPELTGRENIFLNGAILGMHRTEIRKKFDEIVAFAEVEKFLDTPVKRYSSGMYVRLAFAVAAHLEPEILIVDEVLAVGDAAFQEKCLGKMKDVSTKQGRTVLFVSHQLGMVTRLCTRCLLFEGGGVRADSAPAHAISLYNRSLEAQVQASPAAEKGGLLRELATIENPNSAKTVFLHNEPVGARFVFNPKGAPQGLMLGISIQDAWNRRVFSDQYKLDFLLHAPAVTSGLELWIPKCFLAPGSYSFLVVVHLPGVSLVERHEGVGGFLIKDGGSELAQYENTDYGCVQSPCKWKTCEL